MNILRILPVILSFLLIGAHFQRAGYSSLALLCLLTPCLLFVKRSWSIRVVQVLLLISSVEWLRTLFFLIDMRQDAGMPWTRLAFIIGGVALFTAASACTFLGKNLRKRYGV